VLDHLRVANLGVLENAAIDPSPGFTVITGETGAGKTLLLGGLRLILGGRADSGAVGPFGDVAQVDGLFVIEEDELGASRIVPRDGRSRAHLEGTIVSAATLEDRLGSLVEIVGQHDQLSLTRPSYLLELLDWALTEQGTEARAEYIDAWDALQLALDRQKQLGGDQIALARELDLTRYQAEEIGAARLEAGLDERLEADVSRLRNVEEIREHLVETVRITESIGDMAGELVSRLRKASGLDPALVGLAGEADGLAATVSELGRDARDSADALDTDPGHLDELEERLTDIGDLKRKYGKTIDDVIAFGEEAARRADELESLINDADRIDARIAKARGEVRTRATALHLAREKAAASISERIEAHLADLGLSTARVAVEVDEVEPGPSGGDRVRMMFASDERLEPGDIGSVASGGELSRLVLALRLATRSDATSTLVFDEVDTGIGGQTALAMGNKLAELASSNQVLCVTHLPQVAARADTHYVVDRPGGDAARVRLVTDDERVAEISRMLAGLPESEAGRSAAAELLSEANSGAKPG
jgi:DNA repair protein RecN (Recombination protein N)